MYSSTKYIVSYIAMCAVGVCRCRCLQIQLQPPSRMWLVYSGSEFDIRSELLAHKIELICAGVYIMEF